MAYSDFKKEFGPGGNRGYRNYAEDKGAPKPIYETQPGNFRQDPESGIHGYVDPAALYAARRGMFPNNSTRPIKPGDPRGGLPNFPLESNMTYGDMWG